MRQLELDKTSSDLLVCFGLTATAQTTGALLREVGQVAPHIGKVLQEVRAFYECLWQLELLRRCESSEDRLKVSMLYGEVSVGTIVVTKSFFDTYSEGARPFKCAFDENYAGPFERAVREYIQGNREVSIKESGDVLVDNAVALVLRIGRLAGLTRPALDAVHQVVSNEWTDALALKFLTQFDFASCPARGSPPSWLKQRPVGMACWRDSAEQEQKPTPDPDEVLGDDFLFGFVARQAQQFITDLDNAIRDKRYNARISLDAEDPEVLMQGVIIINLWMISKVFYSDVRWNSALEALHSRYFHTNLSLDKPEGDNAERVKAAEAKLFERYAVYYKCISGSKGVHIWLADEMMQVLFPKQKHLLPEVLLGLWLIARITAHTTVLSKFKNGEYTDL